MSDERKSRRRPPIDDDTVIPEGAERDTSVAGEGMLRYEGVENATSKGDTSDREDPAPYIP